MEEKQKTAALGALQETETPIEGSIVSQQQQQQQAQQHSGTGTSLTRFLICMAPVMVSLPGSNESSIEQPAILQVLSQLNAPEENEQFIHKAATQQNKATPQVNFEKLAQDIGEHYDNANDIIPDDKNDDDDRDDQDQDDPNSSSLKNLVSSSSNKDNLDKKSPHDNPSIQKKSTTKDFRSENKSAKQVIQGKENKKNIDVLEDKEKIVNGDLPAAIGKDKILDIESHLIETFNEIAPSEESVGIDELQPAEIELQVGCSKIETKDNVRTVIEVEPAELILKKQVEQILAQNDPLHADQSEYNINGERHVSQKEIQEVAKQLIENIEEEVIKAFEANTYKGQDLLQLQKEKKTEREGPQEEAKQATEDQVDSAFRPSEFKLSQVVDQQLFEVTSILESQSQSTKDQLDVPPTAQNLKLVTVPSPQTASEEAERKLFIDSLPALQGEESTEAEKLALDCKREYYQSLKKYLIQSNTDRPPRPLQTYRWEDLRRARERGGYPWTHLYKRPLGPDEQPEIVLMLRKSQEIRFLSESPKSNKKVRIDDQVLIQETHPYLQELSEEEEEDETHRSDNRLSTQNHENHSLNSESFSCVSDSVLATAKSKAANRFNKVRRLFRRRRYGVRSNDDAQSLPGSFGRTSLQQSLDKVPQSEHRQHHHQKAEPIYVHSKTPRCFPIMKKLKSMAERQQKRLNIKRFHLGKDDKVAPLPDEEPRIIRLKESPKSQRSDIPHFVEKQDSDDVLDIVELDESPSRKRLGRQEHDVEEEMAGQSSIVKPEEIIEISDVKLATETAESEGLDDSKPPKKTPRLRREHVYEEIDHPEDATVAAAEELKFILDATSVEALKQSLATQDSSAVRDVASTKLVIPLDRMGSSEEEAITAAAASADRSTPERKGNTYLLAPISSIDSASSDEDRTKSQLPAVTEEEHDEEEIEEEEDNRQQNLSVTVEADNYIRDNVTKEASPAPSDKKVTFSHVEDEADPHREDIELSPEQMEAAKEANKLKKASNDHEYEPIGAPSTQERSSELNEQRPTESQTVTESNIDQMKRAVEMQKEMEDHFFKPSPTQPTPQTEIKVDVEAHAEEPTEDQPKPEKKGFMATAQDRTRKMHIGLKTQAGKLKTKLKPSAKKSPSGSPKAKDRRMFKAPEFSKMKMPELKRPDMSKFKDFKRPEFTKFSKPDMSKFKLPEMSAIKLGRSKSFKEAEIVEDASAETTETDKRATEATSPQKKLFDFNFGTFPRAQRRKNKAPIEPESSFGTGTATEATSVIPSTETQPSMESSGSPKGDRGPGPVRSRWADKFSDVSYNDSEGSRYRRYGSELESFDRESSLERRMREDLEDAVSEEPNMGILGAVTEDKQFAEFDEENRAIHEISSLRSKEFRRRPMVHQDSDLRSEDSKDAVGWTDREIQKNTLLRKAEMEAEASYAKYPPELMARQDNLSTASSGKKVVLEEIGEDEFFLRKRGISQDNIEINQYIRNAFRDGYDKPINSLQHVGQPRDYGDYDVPPPKPRRLHKHYQPENDSQEFETYGDDLSVSHNGSDYFGAPRRPMRKGRSRSKFSMDSQEVKYMDDEYLRDPSRESGMWNDLNVSGKENIPVRHERSLHDENDVLRPQAPRRQKRRRDNSMDKDSYINGFGGRSVSSSYLQPTEDVIVYRTEHEYHHVPIATPEKYSESISTHKSGSHYDLEDRISRGAISLEQNEQQQQLQQQAEETDRFVIDMMENDGYAVVRKEQVPKPTPPVRRKRFNHSPVDRFATMPNMRARRATPPPERPPPPRGYNLPGSDVGMTTMRKSALSLDARPTYEDDYEEPGLPERNNLQSGEVINKMKYRPLPPPPRPPREKRNRSFSKSSNAQQIGSDEVDVVDGMEGEETEDTGSHFEEVEASTQTDPLPDDFVCEEFEITDDMKIIEPRIRSQTVEDMLKEELEKELGNINHQFIDGDELAKGLQRFREANQRSLSERSRASSQADRSKSQSRPQTPSAIIVERHSVTPVQKDNESMLEASLVVRPIDDLELEEEELRREGLLTDGSQLSIADMKEEEEQYIPLTISEHSYAPSSAELNEALGNLTSDPETQQTDEEVERTLQRYRDELDEIGRQLMEQETTSQEPSPSVSREEIKLSDRDEPAEKPEPHARSKRSIAAEDFKESDREEPSDREEALEISKEDLREPWRLSDIDEMRSSDLEERQSEMEVPATPRNEEAEENTIAPEEYHVEIPLEDRPLPPPRRKSTTAFDAPLAAMEHEKEPAGEGKELTPLQTLDKTEEPPQLPARISDLEVERLRVHALQAGQIMVSQLHGQQINSEELQCKSGNLVVQNIELPPGLIENIVERVRQTERSQLLTVETQTSLENSSESSPVREVVPPPKPPRLRDLEAAAATAPKTSEPVKNTDEQTQTDVEPAAIIPPNLAAGGMPSVFPTPEYLQSLAPLAFYNLHRAQVELAESEPRAPHRHRHRRSASPAEGDDVSKAEESSEEPIRRRRTRSTRATAEEEPQSVTKAGSNFITACSLSLARVINHLTDHLRGKEPKEGVEDATDWRSRQVPALVVLFIVITFVVLIYLVSGQNVHTHHWDYFNPPGQQGRPS